MNNARVFEVNLNDERCRCGHMTDALRHLALQTSSDRVKRIIIKKT